MSIKFPNISVIQALSDYGKRPRKKQSHVTNMIGKPQTLKQIEDNEILYQKQLREEKRLKLFPNQNENIHN